MFADCDYRACEVTVARLLVLWVFNAIDGGFVWVNGMAQAAVTKSLSRGACAIDALVSI